MEPASLGLLFGCFGAISVFCISKYYVQRHWGRGKSTAKIQNMARGATTDTVIEISYERLALMRALTLLLSLAAIGLWFFEPKPYVAGGVAALACFFLWRAWLLRGRILKRLQEKKSTVGG